MTIVVSSVAPGTRKPGVYLDINTRAAKLGLPVSTDKVLLIGTKRSTGTAASGVLIQVFSETEAWTYFGQGSPLALMVKAILEQNPYLSELWCCPLAENPSGSIATGTIAVTATSLTAGTLYLYIGRHVVTVGLADGETSANVASAIASAVNALGWLPMSSGAPAGSTITLSTRVKGTTGNDWVFGYEYTGTGLALALTQPTGGATDPSIQTALDAAFPIQFDIIAVDRTVSADIQDVIDHLDSVSGPMEQRPGVCCFGIVDTVANATTLANTLNSGRTVAPYMRGTRTHPIEMAAAMAGALAAESDRARPLNGIELVVVVAPDNPADQLTRTEQESCLLNGVCCLEVGGQDKVRIVRSVTTYYQNDAGNSDDTLLDVQTIRVLDYVRYAIRYKVQEQLGRVKLAAKAVTPNTTDPDKAKTLIKGVLLQLQNDLGYLERVEEWEDRLIVERDSQVATRLNAVIPADIVDGLHVFAGEIQLILG